MNKARQTADEQEDTIEQLRIDLTELAVIILLTAFLNGQVFASYPEFACNCVDSEKMGPLTITMHMQEQNKQLEADVRASNIKISQLLDDRDTLKLAYENELVW